MDVVQDIITKIADPLELGNGNTKESFSLTKKLKNTGKLLTVNFVESNLILPHRIVESALTTIMKPTDIVGQFVMDATKV